MCCQQMCQELVLTQVFPGEDAPDSAQGTVSFPPTPLRSTGLTLNGACGHLGREGREKTCYKRNSSTAIALQWSAQCRRGLQSLFPAPELQQHKQPGTEFQFHCFPAS